MNEHEKSKVSSLSLKVTAEMQRFSVPFWITYSFASNIRWYLKNEFCEFLQHLQQGTVAEWHAL